MSAKLYDEAELRCRTRELARERYERRWGTLHQATLRTLDARPSFAAWEVARDVEAKAQRCLHGLDKALLDAVTFVEACRTTERDPGPATVPDGCEPVPVLGLPMGTSAQVLAECNPILLRALHELERKRTATAVAINAAEEPTRATWLRDRVADVHSVPRLDLGALAILGNWWPPKATKVAGLERRGMTPEHVVALEADLQDRARRNIPRRRAAHLAAFRRELGIDLPAERKVRS